MKKMIEIKEISSEEESQSLLNQGDIQIVVCNI